MSIRQEDHETARAAPRGSRLDAVLRVGVDARPSQTSQAYTMGDMHDVDETAGFFDGTKMTFQARRFVDAALMLGKTKESDTRIMALRKIEMLASWKSLLEMAKKRRQIDEVTDEMLSQEFATKVFNMHYEFQERRSHQTANSILKALAAGNVMKLVAKDDEKHARGQELMKSYDVSYMGRY